MGLKARHGRHLIPGRARTWKEGVAVNMEQQQRDLSMINNQSACGEGIERIIPCILHMHTCTPSSAPQYAAGYAKWGEGGRH